MTDGGRDDLDLLLRRAAGFAQRDADERWQVVAELHRRTDPPGRPCSVWRVAAISGL